MVAVLETVCPNPSCGAKIKAKEEYGGRKIRCPKCSSPFVLQARAKAPTPPEPPEPEPPAVEEEENRGEVPSVPLPASRQAKKPRDGKDIAVLNCERYLGNDCEYTKPHRLKDVLALIQFLALDPDQASYTEGPLNDHLSPPKSAPMQTWADVALDHPEFFRVSKNSPGRPVRFIARWLCSKSAKEAMKIEDVQRFLVMAVNLHEEQVNHQRLKAEKDKAAWMTRTSMVGSVVAAIATLGTLITFLIHR